MIKYFKKPVASFAGFDDTQYNIVQKRRKLVCQRRTDYMGITAKYVVCLKFFMKHKILKIYRHNLAKPPTFAWLFRIL